MGGLINLWLMAVVRVQETLNMILGIGASSVDGGARHALENRLK